MWLRNCWQVAAFTHEVVGGQLFARRICDEPVVLYRALDGQAGRARGQVRAPLRAAVERRADR